MPCCQCRSAEMQQRDVCSPWTAEAVAARQKLDLWVRAVDMNADAHSAVRDLTRLYVATRRSRLTKQQGLPPAIEPRVAQPGKRSPEASASAPRMPSPAAGSKTQLAFADKGDSRGSSQAVVARTPSLSHSSSTPVLSSGGDKPILGRAMYFLRTGELPTASSLPRAWPLRRDRTKPAAVAPSADVVSGGQSRHSSPSRHACSRKPHTAVGWGASAADEPVAGLGPLCAGLRGLKPVVEAFNASRAQSMRPFEEMEAEETRIRKRAALVASALTHELSHQLTESGGQSASLGTAGSMAGGAPSSACGRAKQQPRQSRRSCGDNPVDDAALLAADIAQMQRLARHREMLLTAEWADSLVQQARRSDSSSTGASSTLCADRNRAVRDRTRVTFDQAVPDTTGLKAGAQGVR
jgi:hypothetical protein